MTKSPPSPWWTDLTDGGHCCSAAGWDERLCGKQARQKIGKSNLYTKKMWYDNTYTYINVIYQYIYICIYVCDICCCRWIWYIFQFLRLTWCPVYSFLWPWKARIWPDRVQKCLELSESADPLELLYLGNDMKATAIWTNPLETYIRWGAPLDTHCFSDNARDDLCQGNHPFQWVQRQATGHLQGVIRQKIQ